MYHDPVLCKTTIDYLATKPGGIYLDGTLGGGGHAEEILARLNATGRYIGLDLDAEALAQAGKRLHAFRARTVLARCNFKNFETVLDGAGIKNIDGILLDLGVSSHQIDTARRGFSFSAKGDLDMRMDQGQELTAADIVNYLPEAELSRIIWEYGEERRSRAVARAVVGARAQGRIESTEQLARIVSRVLPAEQQVKSLARVFQALRIAVNDELVSLRDTLHKSMGYLNRGGRIVVLSYHSLEDRIVKNFFKYEAAQCECPPELPVCVCNKKARLKILTRRPRRPEQTEIEKNPRSRSAKLRVAEVMLNA